MKKMSTTEKLKAFDEIVNDQAYVDDLADAIAAYEWENNSRAAVLFLRGRISAAELKAALN